MVTANCLIELPGNTGNERRGNEHGSQNQGDRNDRPGYLLHRHDGRIVRGHALFNVMFNGFHYDDGVVHHQSDGQHQAEQGKCIDENPSKGKTMNVPISETGTASSGISVARQP